MAWEIWHCPITPTALRSLCAAGHAVMGSGPRGVTVFGVRYEITGKTGTHLILTDRRWVP